jgi:hypothetical protein
MQRRRRRSEPFNLDRVVLAEFLAIMPQFKTNICGAQCDFDDVFDAVVFCSGIPPVPIFELKHCQREAGQIRGNVADLRTSFETC